MLSRLVRVKDGPATLAEYTYLGAGAIVQTTHPGVPGGLNLSLGSGGNYTALDRFGRLTRQAWTTDAGAVLDGYAYGHDRASNPLYRENLTNPLLSELYHKSGVPAPAAYDGLNRLTDWRRGTLRRPDCKTLRRYRRRSRRRSPSSPAPARRVRGASWRK